VVPQVDHGQEGREQPEPQAEAQPSEGQGDLCGEPPAGDQADQEGAETDEDAMTRR
jgi:hypothetical protein